MSPTRSREVGRAGLALATATGLLCVLASAPVRAGDDGAAPIWMGLYSLVQPIVGFGGDDWKTLYFTSRAYLGAVNVKIAGVPVPTPKKS